jgi:glucokinase
MSDASLHSAQLDHVPFPVLIGDIGGTNARFALVESATSAVLRLPTVHTADFPTIDDAVQAAVIEGAGARPKSAILALAGPITGERVPLTNCDWVVEPRKAAARFGLEEMILLNDFEAQALALPDLTPADLDPIGDGEARANAVRVVLGPGTGLGVGGLVRAGSRWVPVPGEGPHIDLGPITDRDMAIWPNLERVHGRITAEAVLSGPGMLRLYRAICATDGVPRHLTSPVEVTAAGLAASDAQAAETLTLFATYLGRVAGDVALIFMAYGGVYLGGGIPPRIASVLKAGAFRSAFVAKAPHDELMTRMATAIIVKEDAALAGIAGFARAPYRFAVELERRRWRR